METVEVMIKLSKDLYNGIECRDGSLETEYVCNELMKAIDNGVLLPENHGRLFILDEELAKKYFTEFSFSCQKWISEVGISEATLKVIESNKEVSECFSTNQI